MTTKIIEENLFTISLDEVMRVLDIYGETYLRDCVDVEADVFELVGDLVDFRKAIRLPVVVAVHRLASSLRDELESDCPKSKTIDNLIRSISKVTRLL